MRSKLPGSFESKYKSEKLKALIADDMLWGAIPCVTYPMDSNGGKKRLKQNDILFSFIDQYFPDDPFAFEPNMQDGRYVFLPEQVRHQGMGVCASLDVPGFLEVGHFWYPREFTARGKTDLDQIYVPMFSSQPDERLVEMVREVYMRDESSLRTKYCTFPFFPGCVVTLKGDFLDNLAKTENTIRTALKDESAQVQKNGAWFIQFLRDLCRETSKPFNTASPKQKSKTAAQMSSIPKTAKYREMENMLRRAGVPEDVIDTVIEVEKNQKNFKKHTGVTELDAFQEWQSWPESRRQKNLRSAFCVNCNTGVFKPGYTVRRSDGFIVLEGECAICGSPMVKFCV
jgi:hypothetical protein